MALLALRALVSSGELDCAVTLKGAERTLKTLCGSEGGSEVVSAEEALYWWVEERGGRGGGMGRGGG